MLVMIIKTLCGFNLEKGVRKRFVHKLRNRQGFRNPHLSLYPVEPYYISHLLQRRDTHI